jgi:dTDP-4-amino-4,6-dideoxygalactose transaminase
MSTRNIVLRPVVTQEMRDAAIRVLDSGHYIRTTPDEVSEGKSLEEEFGAFIARTDGSRPHVANVANGTAAMHLAWLVCDIQPGDEIVVPANTFSSVAHCVTLVGAKPVFADVAPDIYNIDPTSVEAVLTPRTRAIMPVHTAGHPADMDPILEIAKKHGLAVVEDACQCIGGRYKGEPVGTFGDIGTYSFVQNKSLTCGGEGGALASFDEAKIRRAWNLANHGRGAQFHAGNRSEHPTYEVIHDEAGYNYRQSEILSAIGRVQLRSLPEWIQIRKQRANLYRKLIAEAELPVKTFEPRPWADHSYVRFETRVPHHRDALMRHLQANGIKAQIHYPTPLHLDEPYKSKYGYRAGMLPAAELLAKEILTLPLYPQLTEDDCEYVVGHMKTFFAKLSRAAS